MCAPKTMVKIGIVIVAALVIGWLTFPEMQSRIIALAPFAIVLICPLAMLFGMRGHEGHGGHGASHGTSSGHSSGGGCCEKEKRDDARAKPSERKE